MFQIKPDALRLLPERIVESDWKLFPFSGRRARRLSLPVEIKEKAKRLAQTLRKAIHRQRSNFNFLTYRAKSPSKYSLRILPLPNKALAC
mgnify:CR=1 FL=1